MVDFTVGYINDNRSFAKIETHTDNRSGIYFVKSVNLLHYSTILNNNRKDDVCVVVRSQWKTVNLMNLSRL